jgi:phage-related protein
MTSTGWEVEFYETDSGRCPTKDFIDSLQAKEQDLVMRGMGRLETYGPDLRRPYVDYLRDDIYELRISTPGGKLRFFYFFFDRRKMIVTHAIKKKTSDVPPNEIDKAVAYREDYLQRSA